MKTIAIVGRTRQPETLLADLLHWHGLSVFQVDSNQSLLSLLSFISPELIIIESSEASEPSEPSEGNDIEGICDRIQRSPIVGNVPVIVCTDRPLDTTHVMADAYLCAPYSAEDLFAYIQALRPLRNSLSNSVITSAGIDS